MRNRRLWWVMFAGILLLCLAVGLIVFAVRETEQNTLQVSRLYIACLTVATRPADTCMQWAVSVYEQSASLVKNCDTLENNELLNCLAKQGIKPDG